jgi:hypothetical protein
LHGRLLNAHWPIWHLRQLTKPDLTQPADSHARKEQLTPRRCYPPAPDSLSSLSVCSSPSQTSSSHFSPCTSSAFVLASKLPPLPALSHCLDPTLYHYLQAPAIILAASLAASLAAWKHHEDKYCFCCKFYRKCSPSVCTSSFTILRPHVPHSPRSR